jgi:hypothetical protein
MLFVTKLYVINRMVVLPNRLAFMILTWSASRMESTVAGGSNMGGSGVEEEALLDAVRRLGGGRTVDVARAVNLAPRAVAHRLGRLAASGAVRRDGSRWVLGQADSAAGPNASIRARTRQYAAPKRSLIESHRHLLGVVFDHVIARQCGVSVETVRLYRTRHGIPSAASKAGHPGESAFAAVGASAPLSQDGGGAAARRNAPDDDLGPRPSVIRELQLFCAWLEDDTTERLIVAPSIVDAAHLASGAFGRRVQRIEYRGQAFMLDGALKP